jgi:hypothetical protein
MIETDILLAIFGVQNKKISIRDHICIRRFQRTREDTRPKRTPFGWQVGPASPTPMPDGTPLWELSTSFWSIHPPSPRVPSTSIWSSVENGRKNSRSDPFRFLLLFVRFHICEVRFPYLRKWERGFSVRFSGIPFSPEIDPYLFRFLSRFKSMWDV